MKLTDFKALSFDCYGTLIDWERGILQHVRPLLDRLDQRPPDDWILEAHARHEAWQQRQTPTKPYRELLAVVYRRLAEELGVPASWDDCLTYGHGVKKWIPFQDSVGVLLYLKKHFKLIVLSNVDNETFSSSNNKLQVEFDAIYTAEDIGSYKPSLRNFEYMLHQQSLIGIRSNEILHVAESLYHDHAPANELGLASCWIYRRFDQPGFGAASMPEGRPTYDFQFNSLADLAKAHQDALRSEQDPP
jgi:putative hydrolase of the HAD superfamily